MKRFWLAMAVGCAAAVAGIAQETVAPVAEKAPAEKTVSLVRMGSVDDALVQRVRQFAQDNLSMPVRTLPAQEAAPETLDGAGQSAAKLMGPDEVAVVALVGSDTCGKAHGVLMKAERAAVVNIKSLEPADQNAETMGRRAEKETMQSVGMLFGLEACPNPQCVMSPYTTDDELDAKGRNFCPPCLEKVQKAGKSQGLRIIEAPAMP